ncbi:MAG TPA: site-2 protease family protein [Pararobbsia sp.]|nr:site-2 protease family protein [Pararobbsia sp.]
MYDTLIQNIAVNALPVVFAITLHEAAHGYVARLRGDNTAYMLGRISLNPARHIDPVGTIIMPLVLYFLTNGAFLFGYAKPVPVNFGALKNPRWDSLLVSIAGPACNFVQAILWGVVAIVLNASGVEEPFFVKMASAGILVNLVLCALNLFPLPPLDGGRVLASLLPPRQGYALSRVEPYGFFIVMVLVTTGAFASFWLMPLTRIGLQLLGSLLNPLSALIS